MMDEHFVRAQSIHGCSAWGQRASRNRQAREYALVGGACLTAGDFLAIARACNR
jgi:hypothetical protein